LQEINSLKYNHFPLLLQGKSPRYGRWFFILSLKDAVITVHTGGKQKEKFMISLPNIRNLQGFLKGEWDLSKYDSCFPGRNRLGDVDGSIEINGFTMHIEFKASKYAINKGQILKAIRQAKYSNISTLFIFGETNNPEEYLFFTPDNLQPDYQECTEDSIKEVISGWSATTAKNNLVESRTEEWKLTDKYC
jgi:hypothetical protein